MLDIMLAAALATAPAADPCHAAGQPEPPRPGCPAWRAVFRQPGTEVFVDPASVRRSGDGFEMQWRVTFDRAVDGGRSAIITYRFECRAHTIATLHAVFYDVRGVRISSGRPTGAAAHPGPAPPFSPYGGIMTEFCPR
jgi:hypothetical protein